MANKLTTSSNNWERLIERYADGRVICNCRCAYYTLFKGSGCQEYLACANGCSANQYLVKEDIAKRVVEELGILR